MQRLRFYDCRFSRLPTAVGRSREDVPNLADFVNTAQRRLLYAREAGDEGWLGTFAEMVFTINPQQPHVTLPRGVARLELVDVCRRPVPVQNQFYEYLQYGNGRMPHLFRACHGFRGNGLQVYSRNNVVTFTDMTAPPNFLAAFVTNPADYGKRILFQGLDNNNAVIYSQDGVNQVLGIFATFATPFVQTTMLFNQITGIQKDVTAGEVQIFQVNPSTGQQILLLTMEPSETTAWYRRYFFHHIPINACCPTPINQCQLPQVVTPPSVEVSAIAKLDLVPVMVDPDYCLLQNVEAIIEEAQSARYDSIDTAAAKTMAAQHHRNAIGLLNGELTHFLGRDMPAVEFKPFWRTRPIVTRL